jgi:hypothetical protein
MSEKSESLSPRTEEIQGELIDHVSIGNEGIHIYFNDGSYRGYSAALDVNKFGVIPILDRENGYWGRIKEKEEGPTAKQLTDLWILCRKFVNKYKPSCPESINQVDEINLACTDFVEEICNCVGYYEPGSKED